MATTNTTAAPTCYVPQVDSRINRPQKGKLRYLGGNIGFDFPISIDVIDETGSVFAMNLDGLLSRLDDFEGHRGKVTTSENLISCCFIAHEYSLMTSSERGAFEAFVRSKISAIGNHEVARRLVLGGAAA